MTHDVLLRRIEALLHHPPERSLTKGLDATADEAEREAAKEHMGNVQITPNNASSITAADYVAAGANEYHFPGQGRAGTQGPPVAWGMKPILCHPLSGKKLDLSQPPLSFSYTADDDSDAALRDAVDEVLEEIPQEIRDSHNKLALWLWRNLPDQLRATNSNGSNIPWHLLPADPRIPDHSVWEHLSLTAALATAGLGAQSGKKSGDWQDGQPQPSTATLFLFTIGPVQDFVGAARKTRDLKAGSYLLSYLTWQAIQVVAEAFGPEAILSPDLRNQPLVDRWLEDRGVLEEVRGDTGAATIPNRFFAVIPDDEVVKIAEQAEKAVRDEFRTIGRYALDKIQANISDSWKKRVAWTVYEQQVRDYFECYWTALPLHRFGEHDPSTFITAFKEEYKDFLDWDDEKADAILEAFSRNGQQPNVGAVYGRLYRLTEALMGSRKALRNFEPVGEHGYRCSLIPSLPALTPSALPADTKTDTIKTPGPKYQREFWEHIAGRMERGYITEREQLSAVALTKRFLGDYLRDTQEIEYNERFPSTGSFATADFKADVIDVLKATPPLSSTTQALKSRLEQLQEALKPLEAVLAKKGLSEQPLKKLAIAADRDDLLTWLASLDGGWLFTGYDAKQIAKEYGFPQIEEDTFKRENGSAKFTVGEVKAADDALSAFIRAATDAGIDRPSKYYAVIQMDGDKMGEWLSGQRAPFFGDVLHPAFEQGLRDGGYGDWIDLIDGDPETGKYRRPLTPALHLAISRALGVFSLDLVPRLTEQEHLGQRIYSGGDDVLAFSSFRDALPMAHRLRAAFSGQVAEGKEKLEPDWKATTGYIHVDGDLLPTMGDTATASTGIVIAHYKQSLQQVFREAHHACEQVAKDDIGRNALAFIMLKRSGERVQTGTPWYPTTADEKPNTDVDLAVALQRYAELIRGRWVSVGYTYDLDAEKAGLSVFEIDRLKKIRDNDNPIDPAHEAISREAFRVFQRHTEALRSPDTNKMPGWLATSEAISEPEWLAESANSNKPNWSARAYASTVLPLLNHNPLDRLLDLLNVAQFLGQGGAR